MSRRYHAWVTSAHAEISGRSRADPAHLAEMRTARARRSIRNQSPAGRFRGGRHVVVPRQVARSRSRGRRFMFPAPVDYRLGAGRREVRGADSAAPVWRMILRAASNGSSGEATPPEPLQINKTTSSWPSWPSSLSSSPPSSPSWLSSPWHPHGFGLTSTSRGMLGDRPVRSLIFNPSRFAEICRLFFSIVQAS